MAMSVCVKTAAAVIALFCIFSLTSGYRHYIPSSIRRGLTKGQEEIGPIDNYTCTDNGAFPHEECDLFIECWSGVATLHRCTEIMLFDLRYNGCNYAEYVDCGDRHRPPTYPSTTTPKTTSTTQDPSAPTQGPTTPPPNGTFECPANGVFPHAEKCEYYWSCYDEVATLVHCELDYLFDLKYNGCNFPDQTDCGDRERPIISSTTTSTKPSTTPTTTSETSGGTEGSTTPSNGSTTTRQPGDEFECPRPDGFFPDPEDCGAYYSCETGVPTRLLCPEGLHFSPEKEICDWPETAGCEIRKH